MLRLKKNGRNNPPNNIGKPTPFAIKVIANVINIEINIHLKRSFVSKALDSASEFISSGIFVPQKSQYLLSSFKFLPQTAQFIV